MSKKGKKKSKSWIEYLINLLIAVGTCAAGIASLIQALR